MTDTTCLFAAEEAFIAALEASEALKEVAISRDKEPTRPEEYVWLYKAEAKRNYETLGFLKFREDVTMELLIQSLKGPANEIEPSRERAHELLSAVEEVLATDRSLNESVVYSRIANLSPTPVELDGKQGFRITVIIEARGRI